MSEGGSEGLGVCAYVCVRGREREIGREREGGRGGREGGNGLLGVRVPQWDQRHGV